MAQSAEKRVTYSSLAAVLPEDSFLRPEFQARDLDELMSPLLIFDDMIPKQVVDSDTFSYQIETTGAGTGARGSAADDVRKEYAPLRADGSEFAYLTVSPLEMAVGVLQARGVAFKLTEAGRAPGLGIDPLSRTRRRVAYWLAEQINAEMVTSMTNDFSVVNTDDTSNNGFATALAANNEIAVLGDFRNYYIFDRVGFTIRRNDSLYMGNDQVGFFATRRGDGQIGLTDSFKILKCAAS